MVPGKSTGAFAQIKNTIMTSEDILNAWQQGDRIMNRLRMEKIINQSTKKAPKPIIAKFNFNSVANKILQLQNK